MKKKFVRVMFFGALALSTITYVGCKDYDDDIKNLQEQVDANKSAIADVESAIKNGKFVVSYQAVADGYELKLSDGSSLTIKNGTNGETGKPGLDGKSVIPKFKVSSDNYWMLSTDDGKTYDYVLDETGKKVNATGQKGDQGEAGKPGEDGKPGEPGKPGADASANVTINKDGYIVIGDVVTTIKYNAAIPSIIINEVDGLYIVTIDGKEYKMLAEGSAYNGLQSVTYRKQYADDYDDYVTSIKLMSEDGENLLATSAAKATFKVWPKTMDLAKATFEFTDTYKTRAAKPALTYVAGSAKWVETEEGVKDGILEVTMAPSDMETYRTYASSLDITINGHTTASDYFNFQTEQLKPSKLRFVHVEHSTADVPCQNLSTITPTTWFDNNYPEYTFVYDESYNLNDSVALGYYTSFKTMEEMGFSGIKVAFKQTEEKAQGIFKIENGVVTVKSSNQASAINEVCYVTATYSNAAGEVINTYDFAVKAVREKAVTPAPVDIVLTTANATEAGKLAKLAYSTSEQKIGLDVRAFLSSLGGRDYMCDNKTTTSINYPLYYLSTEDSKNFANFLTIAPYVVFTPGLTTDKDKLELIVPAGTIINEAVQFFSYVSKPTSGNKYELTASENYNWRKVTTTFAVNNASRQYTLKLNDKIKCERKVEITQNTAFIVNGATTIIGAWDETAKSFTMTANLEDLYATSPSTEQVDYKLAPADKQSKAVQAALTAGKIVITNNVITVAPVVDVTTLGAIKIEAYIAGTDIKATIKDKDGKVVEYCEPVLRSPLDALTVKAVDWKIDGDANKTVNVGTKATIKMIDKDINVTTKNTVIENGQIKTPWAAAYGIAASNIEYKITKYSATVNDGTFSIDKNTGVLTCNNTAIALNVDITVSVTVSHNWGSTTNTVVVKASLQ